MESLGNVILALVTMVKPYSIPLLVFCVVIGGLAFYFGAIGKRFALSILIGSILGFVIVNNADDIAQTLQKAINF